MTRSDINYLIKLIQLHRPYFASRFDDTIYKELINEWERLMGPYEYKDVKNNLEKFLKDEANANKEPDAYNLIRGLLTIKEKQEGTMYQVSCQFCGRYMNRLELGKHEDRCRSINYLKRLYKKYYNQELADIRELYQMSEDNFDKAYIRVLERVRPLVTNKMEYRGITNVIETYYGRPPIFGIDEII